MYIEYILKPFVIRNQTNLYETYLEIYYAYLLYSIMWLSPRPLTTCFIAGDVLHSFLSAGYLYLEEVMLDKGRFIPYLLCLSYQY